MMPLVMITRVFKIPKRKIDKTLTFIMHTLSKKYFTAN
jgi:hypothetical protein